jgi:hypothetical protein
LWFDHDLVNGDRWDLELRARVDQAAAIVVVMSPEAAAHHCRVVIISPLRWGRSTTWWLPGSCGLLLTGVLEQVRARVEVKRAADGQATDRPGAEAVVPLRDDGHRWDALQEYGAEREG